MASQAVEYILAKLRNVRQNGRAWVASCPVPSHGKGRGDLNPSLSISEGDDGRVLLKCFAGCSTETICQATGIQTSDLFVGKSVRDKIPVTKKPSPSSNGKGCYAVTVGLTRAQLAEAKKLPEEFLARLGCTDSKYRGAPAVKIPYHNEEGTESAVRWRMAMFDDKENGISRFAWRSGDKVQLYGLERLRKMRDAGWVLLVEGESDCWTGWFHDLPVLGVPGMSAWQRQWADHVKGLDVYVWEEPNARSFSNRIGLTVDDIKVIAAPEGIKDISEAYILGHDIVSFVENLKGTALSYHELLAQEREQERQQKIVELESAAATVLAAEDPLELVRREFVKLGYGGDVKAPLVVYIAATSRVLSMRPGSMPVHLILIGPASAGKSYTLSTALRLLPKEAYHTIDAGSPRVLIYDTTSLQHRVVVFSEADSLPAGEDNPAASAIRGLLQDSCLHYKTVIKDDDGCFTVQDIRRDGPSPLFTTSTKRLGVQLMSRLFEMEVADDLPQLRASLAAQAAIELSGVMEPDKALIDFQAYLQVKAPFDVLVPFAPQLSTAIGKSAAAPRINRDFARLLSLIKSVAVLRHKRRQVVDGRIVAEIDDYRTIHELVGDMYEGSVGASKLVREAVQAVADLIASDKKPISEAKVAAHLGISKMSASRRVRTALREGWLVNHETQKGRPMILELGDPLPARSGLPSPGDIEAVMSRNTITPLTDGSSGGRPSSPACPDTVIAETSGSCKVSAISRLVETPESLDGLRQRVLASARMRSWTSVELRSGTSVIAGEDNWDRFVHTASPEDLERALQIMRDNAQ